MKKIGLPIVLDSIFTLLISFLILFSFLNFYLPYLWLAILLAIFFAIILTIISFFILNKRYSKRLNSKKEIEEKNNLFLKLAVSTLHENKKLFTSLFVKQGFTVNDCNNFLILSKEQTKACFLCFTIEPFSADEVAKIKQSCPDRNIVLYVNELSSRAKELCTSLNFEIITSTQIYKDMKENELLPADKIILQKKSKLKERLYYSTKRSNYKGFLVSGLMILSLSFVSFYPLYYLISGTILLLLSSFIRFIGHA